MIFGDEPTGALDSKSATDLLESMKSLNEYDNSTILMVTHDALQQVIVNELFSLKMVNYIKNCTVVNQRVNSSSKIVDVMSSISGGMADDLI